MVAGVERIGMTLLRQNIPPNVPFGFMQVSQGGGNPFGEGLIVSPVGTATPGIAIKNNGADYGPDTAGTTTSGIQEAINALASTGGRIFLRKGIFYCTGSLSSANALITLPLVSPGTSPYGITITIEGECSNFVQNETATFTEQSKSGTIIYAKNVAPSSTAISNQPYSILAGPFNTNGYAGYQNSVSLVLKNLCFMQPYPASYTAVNTFSCISFSGDGIQALLDTPFQNLVAAPANVQACGIIAGGSGSTGFSLQNFECTGYYVGAVLGSHTAGDNWNITACFCAVAPAFKVTNGITAGSHRGSIGGNLVTEWCPYYFGCPLYPIANNLGTSFDVFSWECSTINGTANSSPAQNWMACVAMFYGDGQASNSEITIFKMFYVNNSASTTPSKYVDNYILEMPQSMIVKVLNCQQLTPPSQGVFQSGGGFNINAIGRYSFYDPVNNLMAFIGADSPINFGNQIVDFGLNVSQFNYDVTVMAVNTAYAGALFRLDIRGSNPSTLAGLSSVGPQWYLIMNDAGGSQVVTAGVDIDGNFSAIGNIDAKGLNVAEGTNGRQGVATLVSGTVAVANTTVTANTRIFLTTQSPSGTVGTPYISARVAGTSFTISSTSSADDSVVAYEMFEPG